MASEEEGETTGTQIRVISKYGYSFKTLLSVEMVEDSIFLNWRTYPEKLGAEISHLQSMTFSQSRLTLTFEENFELEMDFEDEETCENMHSCLESLQIEAVEMDREKRESSKANVMSKSVQNVRQASFQVIGAQENLYQLTSCLRLKEGDIVFRRLVERKNERNLSSAFYHWTGFVRSLNLEKMDLDRSRWRLHAIANQELDLQAWYHAVFYHEVYRLRGPFWYKDAILPTYRTSYDIVDNTLTPLEEAALAHVLCSPDTVYADVAGQMFVVQALTTPAQFALFQSLASQGASVIKYPRQGRPAKKLFRFSFVEGKIYLTWKGKFGNQGVDLGEVSHVSMGIGTDVLKKALGLAPLSVSHPDLYLSVVCAGRSVDLCFDTKVDRDAWGGLLGTLCNKEHGSLVGIASVCPPVCSERVEDVYEWGFLYEAIGAYTVPGEARANILRVDTTSSGGEGEAEEPSGEGRGGLASSLQQLQVDPKKGGRILLARKGNQDLLRSPS